MLQGIHGPNAPWSPADNALLLDRGRGALDDGLNYSGNFGSPRFQSVKIMHTHGTRHSVGIAEWLLYVGVKHVTVRLYDSVWPPGSAHGDGGIEPFYSHAEGEFAGWFIPHPVIYADKVIAAVKEFAPVGVLDFQLDCEFNITWMQLGRLPAAYAEWLEQVLDRIHTTPRMPPGVRFGFPSVSFTPKWLPYAWLGAVIDHAARFDYLCVDSYFQTNRRGRDNILAGPMTDRQFGGNCEFYADWQPGMPMQIVEWGNSIHEKEIDGVPVYTPAQIDAFRLEHYPLYLEWLSRHADIEAAHCYISRGATDQWGGFKFPVSVADAMAEVVEVGTGQSMWLGWGRGAF